MDNWAAENFKRWDGNDRLCWYKHVILATANFLSEKERATVTLI